MGREHARLAFEPKNRAVSVRLLQQHAGIIRQVASGKIVSPIHHDVVLADQVQGVFAADPGVMNHHFAIGIDAADRLLG